jgi:hypothetical protein
MKARVQHPFRMARARGICNICQVCNFRQKTSNSLHRIGIIQLLGVNIKAATWNCSLNDEQRTPSSASEAPPTRARYGLAPSPGPVAPVVAGCPIICQQWAAGGFALAGVFGLALAIIYQSRFRLRRAYRRRFLNWSSMMATTITRPCAACSQ